MIDSSYWIVTLFLSILLIIIIISEVFKNKLDIIRDANFTILLISVLSFLIIDTFWGLCATKKINGDIPFFVLSSLIHLSTMLTTFFYLKYALDYLKEKKSVKIIILSFDAILVFVQLILVVINISKPVLFSIENGSYITKNLRSIGFNMQLAVYDIVSVVTAIRGFRKKNRKFIVIFLITIAPIIFGALQYNFPGYPLESMGYFVAIFVLHMFIILEDRENTKRKNLLNSMKNAYYTMHLIDLESNKIQSVLDSEIVQNLTKNERNAQDALYMGLLGSSTDEYKEIVSKFVDLSTLKSRMNNKNTLSLEFLGKYHGWTRATFIRVDNENEILDKVMFVTQIIDEEKKANLELLNESNTDALTGVGNRRAYEHYMYKLGEIQNFTNLVLVSIDLNGLKIVNDSLGHHAGDEFIIGAAKILNDVYKHYGTLYRIGGDEFFAILYATSENVLKIKKEINEGIKNYSGVDVKSISMSFGYVEWNVEKLPLVEMIKLADNRLYSEKARFYEKQGVDKRGQSEALQALSNIYLRILRIDLNDESFKFILGSPEDFARYGEEGRTIGYYIKNLYESLIYPPDLANLKKYTDYGFLKDFFDQKRNYFRFVYRKEEEGYCSRYSIEYVPSPNYSKSNRVLYVYFKRI